MRTHVLFLLAAAFLLAGCASTDSALTGQAVHGTYSSFSAPESGFTVGNGLISASDTAVFKTAWYSVNGSSWQSLTLSGSAYGASTTWLSGVVSASLPAALSGAGEHYVIVYTCTLSSGSWDCHGATAGTGGWQLSVINITGSSCGGSVCAAGEYCSAQNACLLTVPGHTYFVAVNGSDANPGTFERPWYSWDRALNADELQPGDIVYFRGGTWRPTGWGDPDWNAFATNRPNRHGVEAAHSGAPGNYIKYWNYPGEVPILDGSGFTVPVGQHYNSGIGLYRCSYLHFKGLVVTNINQDREGVEAGGFGAYETSNLIFENCVAHDVEGPGFSVLEGGLGLPDTTEFINCDSYDNVNPYVRMEGNPYGESAGGIADGFKFDNNIGSSVRFTGCRAWGNSDDAFDISGSVTALIDHCWAYDGGRLAGDGNGIKFGFARDDTETVIRTVTNCISANNNAFGFSEANGGGGYYYHRSDIHNNLVYNNDGGGFGQAVQGAQGGLKENNYRNNIAYDNAVIDAILQFEVAANNTWRSCPGCGGWTEANPTYMVTDADFVSLDASQLTRPRKADGSLPDITFGHLKADSDLIDTGTFIPGYHCATAGAHPGEECVVWYGKAPDLGPFEYSSDSRVSSVIDGQTLNADDYGYQGIAIPRSVPTALTFRNNLITSSKYDGYMLQCGDDDYGATARNLDGAILSGNRFSWTGLPGSPQIHGIMAGYNVDYTILYNYIDGPYYGLVWEGGYPDGKTMVNAAGGVYYTIFRNSKLILAGFENNRIYNNVFYSNATSYAIRVVSNDQLATPAVTKNVKIKNNIFYAANAAHAIEINSENLAGFECDYNVYYGANTPGNLPSFLVDSADTTWAQWRALGYDAHSVVIDPHFIDTVNFVPASRLNYGTDLGAGFLNGLSTSATWGTTDPATNAQNGVWQVGARVY